MLTVLIGECQCSYWMSVLLPRVNKSKIIGKSNHLNISSAYDSGLPVFLDFSHRNFSLDIGKWSVQLPNVHAFSKQKVLKFGKNIWSNQNRFGIS